MAPFTTGFTGAQLAQLEQNIALGVLEISHNGKTTKFQSTAQAMALRDRIKLELAQAAAAAAAQSAGTVPVAPCMTRPTIYRRG